MDGLPGHERDALSVIKDESKIRSVGTFLSTNNMKCYPRKTTMRALFVLHVLHDDRTSPAAIAWNGIRCG